MKALLFVFGLVFVVAGIVVGVVSQMDYGNALIGLTPGLAATLLVGGFIVTGLAGVIAAIDRLGDDLPQSLPSGTGTGTGPSMATSTRQEPAHTSGRTETGSKDDMPFPAATIAVGTAAGATGMAIGSAFDNTEKAVTQEAEKGGNALDAAVDKVAEVAKEAKENAKDVTENVADSIDEVADAAKDTTQGVVDKVAELASQSDEAVVKESSETVTDAATAVDDNGAEADAIAKNANAEPETADGQDGARGEDGELLYIVEEVEIRGKQARVLSDNTVEAETAEGWMRFENIEHLEEYLDAMEA